MQQYVWLLTNGHETYILPDDDEDAANARLADFDDEWRVKRSVILTAAEFDAMQAVVKAARELCPYGVHPWEAWNKHGVFDRIENLQNALDALGKSDA